MSGEVAEVGETAVRDGRGPVLARHPDLDRTTMQLLESINSNYTHLTPNSTRATERCMYRAACSANPKSESRACVRCDKAGRRRSGGGGMEVYGPSTNRSRSRQEEAGEEVAAHAGGCPGDVRSRS